ncbi:MAG: acyl carrier protein [Clostridia bacterium]|nr:acyl carrier protein [Clostridia bacterium]
MTRQQITDELKGILISADPRTKDKVNSAAEESNLAADLGLNSVGMLYMVIAIEESFGMRFENVGMNDFKTLKDVIDYIEGKLQ